MRVRTQAPAGSRLTLPPDPPASCMLGAMHDLAAITAPFYPDLEELGRFAPVESHALSEDYQALLDHDDHMTVTVEAFHDTLVDIRVLEEHRDGDFYSRVSLLVCRETGRIVQLGIMRIDLAGLPAKVREGIEARRAPLGRILIRHHILRRVELCQLWRIDPGPVLRQHLVTPPGEAVGWDEVPPAAGTEAVSGWHGGILSQPTHAATALDFIYGRSARIIVEGRPAVELLEIVRA